MIMTLLLIHLAATLAMVGLIWFVQVVHYPLFSQIGHEDFRLYERSHQRLTTFAVAPLMLTEAITALMLPWFRPALIPMAAAVMGVLLVGTLWSFTFFWQVLAHQRLARSFDPTTHRRLVQSNWLRTIAWSARGVLVCWMIAKLISRSNSSSMAFLP